MIPSNSASTYRFRVPPENQGDGMPASVIEDETKEDFREQEEFIRCLSPMESGDDFLG